MFHVKHPNRQRACVIDISSETLNNQTLLVMFSFT